MKADLLCPEQPSLSAIEGQAQPATNDFHLTAPDPHLEAAPQRKERAKHNKIADQRKYAPHKVKHDPLRSRRHEQASADTGKNAAKDQQTQLHGEMAPGPTFQIQTLPGLFHPNLLIGRLQCL